MAERPFLVRKLSGAERLYVAGRGSGPLDGLHRFVNVDSRWRGAHLAVVDQLSALAWHPSLPVIYGVSGIGDGIIHVWDVSSDSALTLTELPTGGSEPCHLAVDPDARMLVVTNYTAGTLTIWPLTEDGSLSG